MKRILDSDFRYTASFETDIRRTFERVRRELAATSVYDRRSRGELAIGERRGHVAVLTLRKA